MLNGANTYIGQTFITAGTLSVNSISSVASPAASALGAPTTVANGTISIGSTTIAGTLLYTGTGTTTDRVINLAGTTGGATIDSSGSGPLVFSSNFTATGAGIKTLTLQGSNSGANTIQGAIVNNSGTNTTALTKTGIGTWVLAGTNTYSGATTVSNGTLNITGSIGGGTSGTAISVSAAAGGTAALIEGVSNAITDIGGRHKKQVSRSVGHLGGPTNVSYALSGQ